MSVETARVDDAAMMNRDTGHAKRSGTAPGIYESPVQSAVSAFRQAAIGCDKDVRTVFRIKSNPKGGRLGDVGRACTEAGRRCGRSRFGPRHTTVTADIDSGETI